MQTPFVTNDQTNFVGDKQVKPIHSYGILFNTQPQLYLGRM